MRLTVDVKHSRWAGPDVELAGGVHEIDVSAAVVRAIAAGAAAGVLEIVDADAKASKVIAGAVEPDEVSLVRQAEAVADGRWHEGHLAQVELEEETGS
jgi:hypothetical protein